jgi:aspartyl-tRNA(Asn)/glutamyl-tRNA(Gln) amidotransferase subunit B
MSSKYQPVIGLEIHAVMETQSKMFCDCPVVDSTHEEPNDAVCPVCAGMPGMLPVLNKAAVEFGMRVALALNCEIQPTSIFARKSYFYPDLPKGFQISQYEEPLATNGWLEFENGGKKERVRIRRVHLEEDTGKLTHEQENGTQYSLVDLNRSGIPLLEIVTEPELHSPEAVRDFAYALRAVMRYLGVNSGNLEKGLLRLEPNISVRPEGSTELLTRVEIKNLNSFRSLERSVKYEIERQSALYDIGGEVLQQTLGWNDEKGSTNPQRAKEVAEDYRYFPEPDLPPLVVEEKWIEQVRKALPELPFAKQARFIKDYALNEYDASLLVAERNTAEFFEETLQGLSRGEAKLLANWITGPLFAQLNETGQRLQESAINPEKFAGLLLLLNDGKINASAAKKILDAMLESGKDAKALMVELSLGQISDERKIRESIQSIIKSNPEQLKAYLAGKEELLNWFFGQAMSQLQGKANPKLLREELNSAFAILKAGE